MAFPDKEECFFCGTEVDRKDGEFIEVMPINQPKNDSGLKVQFARWACNACIAQYKEFMKNAS